MAEMSPEDTEFLLGFIVLLAVLLIAIYLILKDRARRRNLAPGKDDVVCPKCGESVPADADYCKKCGVEFVQNVFECPECGESLHHGVKSCKKCGHNFEEKKEFMCPKCGEPVDKDAKKCPACKEEFWAPVRPPSKD